MMLAELTPLFVGWALGILSSPITDAIRRWSVKKRITLAVRTELQAVQDSFALVVIQVARHRGSLTHALLGALLSTLRISAPRNGKAIALIEDLLHAGEPASPAKAGGASAALSLKVQGTPFLAAQLHRLDFYSHETQRQLLEVRAGCDIFNQFAEEAAQYHFLTFRDGLDTALRASVVANVERCYEAAADRASELVSQIAALLQNPEMLGSLSRSRNAR